MCDASHVGWEANEIKLPAINPPSNGPFSHVNFMIFHIGDLIFNVRPHDLGEHCTVVCTEPDGQRRTARLAASHSHGSHTPHHHADTAVVGGRLRIDVPNRNVGRRSIRFCFYSSARAGGPHGCVRHASIIAYLARTPQVQPIGVHRTCRRVDGTRTRPHWWVVIPPMHKPERRSWWSCASKPGRRLPPRPPRRPPPCPPTGGAPFKNS